MSRPQDDRNQEATVYLVGLFLFGTEISSVVSDTFCPRVTSMNGAQTPSSGSSCSKLAPLVSLIIPTAGRGV